MYLKEKTKMKININGVIGWDVWPFEVQNQLNEASGDIDVYISSDGGYVTDGILIHNMLHEYDKGEVNIYIIHAYSISAYIAMAGDNIKAYDNAIFMIHNAWSNLDGDHHDYRKYADHLESLSEMAAKKYAEVSGKSVEEIKKMMDNTTYFYGEGIMDAGFADEIISTEKDKNKTVALNLAKEEFSSLSAKIKPRACEDAGRACQLLTNKGHMKEFENKPKSNKGDKMDFSRIDAKMLSEKRPDLMKEIREAAYKEGEVAGKEAGAAAEMKRIAEIEAETEPGYEHIIAEMKADTSKTATDAIVAIHNERKKNTSNAAQARSTDGNNLGAQAAALGGGADDDQAEAHEQKEAKAKSAGSAMLSKTKTKPKG